MAPQVTVVTGPIRSGTSCVTGLLELCGFDLGRNIRVLRNETEFNPRGHFEPDLLYTINERLLIEAPGGAWGLLNPPPVQALAEVAAQRERYFQLFIRKFDGNLCKDPLFCLTLPFWEQNWGALERVVFCLRRPLAAARSMNERYLVSVDLGLRLWQIYVSRFFEQEKRSPVYVLDFDAFVQAPVDNFTPLLDWLGTPLPKAELEERLERFFGAEHVHWSGKGADIQAVPSHMTDLYLQIRSLAGPLDPNARPLFNLV